MRKKPSIDACPDVKVISMYTDPPSDEITLDEFELMALDRLQVLRKIEDLKVGLARSFVIKALLMTGYAGGASTRVSPSSSQLAACDLAPFLPRSKPTPSYKSFYL